MSKLTDTSILNICSVAELMALRQAGDVDELLVLFARAIIAAHEAAKPGWISVAERLPKKYEEVMVWPQPTGYCMTGTLGDSGWTYGEYETGWGHVDSMMSDPTHWMQMPTPPHSTSAMLDALNTKGECDAYRAMLAAAPDATQAEPMTSLEALDYLLTHKPR